MIFIIQSWWYF